MSSSGAAQNYFSTHNALGVGDLEDEKILLHISHVDDSSKKVCLFVYPFNNIEMIKRLVMKKFHLPKSTNVSDICIYRKELELRNNQSLTPFINDLNYAVVRLQWCFKDTTPGIGLRKAGLRPPPFLEEIIGEISLAFQRGVSPKLTLDGTGGTYFLFNAKRKQVAMFKPRDEEAFAPNNPRGYEGHFGQKGFRDGVLSGEGALREVAAFLLDAQHGSPAGVPETTQVEACHPSFCYKHTEHLLPYSNASKRVSNLINSGSNLEHTHTSVGMPWKEGSLQEYLDAKDTCGDFDPHVFSVAEAHYIGILDIRLLNLDRNDGNILVIQRTHDSRGSYDLERSLTLDGKISRYTLIPIDHGLILPACMDVADIDLTWYTWPQCKVPFSEVELRHISQLNADRDAARLIRKLDIREDCLRTMRVATRVLQLGSKMHLNLYQIAGLVVRKEDLEKPSIMECAVKEALIQAYTAMSASSFTQHGRLLGSILLDLHNTEATRTAIKSPDQLRTLESQIKRIETQKSDALINKPQTEQSGSTNSQDNHSTLLLKSLNHKMDDSNGILHMIPRAHHALSYISEMWSSSESFDEDSQSFSSPRDCDPDASSSECPPFLKRHTISTSSTTDLCKLKDQTMTCNSQKHEANFHKEEKLNRTSSIKHYHIKENTATSLKRHSALSTTQPRHAMNGSCGMPTPCSNTTSLLPGQKQSNLLCNTVTQRTITGGRWGPASHRSKRNLALDLKSSWTLRDSNRKAIYLDWSNQVLERTFFYCFEHLIQHYITEAYPDWKTFPFCGQ